MGWGCGYLVCGVGDPPSIYINGTISVKDCLQEFRFSINLNKSLYIFPIFL